MVEMGFFNILSSVHSLSTDIIDMADLQNACIQMIGLQRINSQLGYNVGWFCLVVCVFVLFALVLL